MMFKNRSLYKYTVGFPSGSVGKESACNAGDTGDMGLIHGLGIPLEKEMTAHSSILAWRISWTAESGRLQSVGSQRVGHEWSNYAHIHAQAFSKQEKQYSFLYPLLTTDSLCNGILLLSFNYKKNNLAIDNYYKWHGFRRSTFLRWRVPCRARKPILTLSSLKCVTLT